MPFSLEAAFQQQGHPRISLNAANKTNGGLTLVVNGNNQPYLARESNCNGSRSNPAHEHLISCSPMAIIASGFTL
ncbi:MAG: hypothetical protein ACJAWM_001175 [Sulfitobacter sp.]